MIFFVGCTHFGHQNIIKYCNRPFSSVQEMDDIIINNWNSKVQPKDLVYHLGDFSFPSPIHYLPKLNGNIILILGNHDKHIGNLANSNKILSIHDLLFLKMYKPGIMLCHYSLRVWHKSHFNSWHLYSHSHGMLPPQGKSWDVGVDNNNFFPLSIDEIADIMKNRPDNFNLVKNE